MNKSIIKAILLSLIILLFENAKSQDVYAEKKHES